MRTLIVSILFLLQVSKHPVVDIRNDELLSVNGPVRPLAESNLSTNPENPNQLLVAVMQFDSSDGNARTCVAWASLDGGRRWGRHAFPVQGCGDPWGLILPDGTAIMVMLGGMTNAPGNNLFLFRSADGGNTWSDAPLVLGSHHDHPMVIAQRNDVYLVSTEGIRDSEDRRRSSVSLLHSPDDGKTFSNPIRVTPSNLSFEAEGPVVLEDGTILIAFHDHNRQEANKRLMRPRIWLLRSKDQGRTFSEALFASESCEGYGGWPSMAVDKNNRIFLVCVTDRFDGVLVQYSDDLGESWSEPVRVNQKGNADSHTPSIAVNKHGIVGVSWYERHDKSCLDTFFAASLDGGKSFLPERKVSSSSSCPDTAENAGAYQWFNAGGDYSGLAATADGIFHVVWSDSRSGIYRLRTATIEVSR